MTDQSTTTDTAPDPEQIEVSVENLGGIERCSVGLETGVNVLTGKNATNRTSFLRALVGALGGSKTTLKSDADEGRVSVEIGSHVYHREFHRTETGITTHGTPYTDAEQLVDSFVALLEENPARRAVQRGDDLREIIMRPVDTDEIERQIQSLKADKEALEQRLTEVDRRTEQLPTLEERRASLTAEIESINSELETLRAEVEAFEADAEMAVEAEAVMERLDARRQQLNETEDRIDVLTAELDALRDKPAALRSEQAELPDHSKDDLKAVQERLEAVRREKRNVDETITNLTTIVEFNEDVLSGDSSDLESLQSATETPAAELAPDSEQSVDCWTCGTTVKRGDITNRLESLRTVIQEKRSEQTDLAKEASELESKQQSIIETIDRRQAVADRLTTVEEKLNRKSTQLAELETDAAELRDSIETLEHEVAETEELRDTDLMDAYEQISDLQYERGQLQQELETTVEEIEAIEALPDSEQLHAELDDVRESLARERTRITDIETQAVEQFNEHMDDLLAVLGYKNITRVWIERKQAGRESSPATFEMNIVRETESGTVYEDTIDTLSESEREVIGLVFALAGYLVHDVYESIPFMLLDSLEAIDADRISALVDYFSEYAPYLVVALLPEDSAGVEIDHRRVPADTLD
ncbi:archaea-specific SMC-related protein [Natrinema sp. HArc-T2]|uniref:archaea-specific SMC-related protein n=1 Tax=Natrinema sp. HArc-T2 TaxID=3242701 RepID=UPI00359DB8FD